MSRDYSTYESPFCTRYASKEMQYIFSADKKFSTWRRLWVALARAEMNLGIDKITQEMVDELESHITDINYEVAEEREKLVRHDVMSHVYAYGKQCPKAAGIIHLGATSCYVGDNTDVIIMRDALQLVKKKLVNVINNLAKFADEHKSQPCLAYTHLQPAQLTTVGKRASLWINELLMDYEEIEYRISTLKLLGQKGTTGTQASFVELFGGDSAKIKALENAIANEMGFDACTGKRSDLLQKDGQHGPRHPRRYRTELLQVQQRPAYPSKLQGDGRAVREEPDRFLRNALQAQSYAR